MKFEEILPILRAGGKARCANYDNDGEYWVAGYIAILDQFIQPGEDNVKTLTLHRCNKYGNAFNTSRDWGIPRWTVLDDTWEVVE